MIGLGVCGLAGFLLSTWWPTNLSDDRLSVSESWLTLGDRPQSVGEFKRKSLPELVWHIRFEHAPVRRRLWLACDWIDPQGRIAYQNHYQTQPIETPQASTQAVFRLPADAPLGTWKVRLSLAGLPLTEQSFEVQ